jgi:hypothetical protein
VGKEKVGHCWHDVGSLGVREVTHADDACKVNRGAVPPIPIVLDDKGVVVSVGRVELD